MKSKILKKIFAVLVIVSMIIPNLSTVLATQMSHDETEVTLGISALQPIEGYGFKLNDKKVYRIYKGSNDGKNAIYCLNREKYFPTENVSGETQQGTYTNAGEFNTTNVQSLEDGIKNNFTALDKMISNFYVDDDTHSQYEAFVTKTILVPLNEYEEEQHISPKTEYSDISDNINVDDIFFAQQIAIWKYTNNIDTNTLVINYTTNGEEYNDKISFGYEQKEAYINQIVKYLTSSTITKSNNYKTTASLWRAKNDSQNKMQTLLYITNEPLKYDAALSKTIVGIKKSGESQFESISNREKGAVEKDSNKSEGEDKQTKSDLAKISVSKGDQIKYRITVYNQGEQNIRITKIKDYLPDGLILASNQDNWSNGTTSDGKKYILTSALENTILYTEENKDTANNKNSQLSIEVICEVADTATGTLRNYAEIAEMKNEAGNSIISTDEDSTPDNYKDGTKNEDDTDFEEVEVQGEFDLALKKYVNQIIRNGQTISYSQSRNNSTRSTKNSNPVNIQVGDIVIFNINVKNQGLIDGTVTKITDYIPAGLAYLPDYSTSSTNLKWSLPSSVETKGITDYSDDVTKNLIASDFNKSLDQISIIEGGNLAITYNDEIPVTKAINGNETVSDAIQVACLVTSTENTIKNIAEISAQKETLEDIDSVPGNLKNDERTPKTVDETVDGFSYEDDEDFDVLEPRNLDIRKYVKQVKSGSIITDGRTVSTGTIQEVDTIDKTNPVPVKKGDIVTFGIRVYNEGNSDVESIRVMDIIPEGLKFMRNNSTNNSGWEIYEITTSSNADITYNGVSYHKISTNDEDAEVRMAMKTISRIDGSTSTDLKYAELLIDCIVESDDLGVLENKAILIDDGGKHDEDRVEPPGIYDVSLQKFITKVNEKVITDREPKVTRDSSTGKLSYTNVTDPYVVFNGDKVEYTIRVYNQGNQDTYASQIIDDLPEGIKFLADNQTNKDYEWKMYKEASNSDTDTIIIKNKKYVETTKVDEADIIVTDYLKRKEITKDGTTTVTDPIPAYDKDKNVPSYTDENNEKQNNPSYQDVKVVFEVVQANATTTEDTSTIINTATVTEITDKDGSTEDDQNEDDNSDKEYIRLTYFDLALLKYCTKVIVEEDGAVKETETGYTGTENPEPVAKVEINKKKIDSTVVKFEYTIKVMNQGEIEGFATEITDIIPEGLAFYAEDNKQYGWVISKDGQVTTDYLIKELIKPGESKEIKIVLRWENSEANLGQKVNTAAITGDYNEFDVPDIDSDPSNLDETEDDIDTAPVLISIKTGKAPIYIGIIISSISLLAIGGFLIKKYVL